GDAIAGLAITAINLMGGVAIGVLRMDYDVAGSLEVYGRLAIGDGLLAQIPALLVSLAAGVLVARVDREGEPAGFATWLEPAMLVVPAVFLVVLAFVPEMPTLAFLSTATALVTAAFVLASRVATRRQSVDEAERAQNILVALSPSDVDDARAQERTLAAVWDRCCDALGMEIPSLDLQIDHSQPSGKLELRLGDRLLARVDIDPSPSDDVLAVAVFRAVMDHATALVDLQDLGGEIDALRSSHPVVVNKAMEALEPADLLEVVRGFLRERIPRPPLGAIMATIAESRALRALDARTELPERVRELLAAHWLPPLFDGLMRLGSPTWLRLDADAESELLAAIVGRDDGMVLAMDAEERAGWLQRIGDERSDSGPVVLVTTPRARRAVVELVAAVKPRIHVLSISELDRAGVSGDVQLQWLSPPP
ncbi:MAG: FHIPEP family type III secretion protein, partial [Nannocystaceae bacterium]|nr:FHIPEP family type III secretion protein [Nannocystaceae bacterium]